MSERETSGARELNIDEDFVRLIVAKARAVFFDMPDAEQDEMEREVDLDPATTVTEDDGTQLSDEAADDGTRDELIAMIDSLNVDEQAELIALTWIGQGDYEPSDLETAVRAAKQRADGPASTLVLEMELFPSHLEAGLDSHRAWSDAQPA